MMNRKVRVNFSLDGNHSLNDFPVDLYSGLTSNNVTNLVYANIDSNDVPFDLEFQDSVLNVNDGSSNPHHPYCYLRISSEGCYDKTILLEVPRVDCQMCVAFIEQDPPEPTAIPTATPEPTEVIPTATPEPTEVIPTATPEPTEVIPTPIPTSTPEPTPTEVIPTSTPEPTPTEVIPTSTPEPTPTEVIPTPEPTPTEVIPTPEPTATPIDICVINFGASMTPCIGGTVDEYMEGYVDLNTITPVDAIFELLVGYIPGTTNGNCGNLLTYQTLSVTVFAGNSSGLLNCDNGAPFIDFDGATICTTTLEDGPYSNC